MKYLKTFQLFEQINRELLGRSYFNADIIQRRHILNVFPTLNNLTDEENEKVWRDKTYMRFHQRSDGTGSHWLFDIDHNLLVNNEDEGYYYAAEMINIPSDTWQANAFKEIFYRGQLHNGVIIETGDNTQGQEYLNMYQHNRDAAVQVPVLLVIKQNGRLTHQRFYDVINVNFEERTIKFIPAS